MSMIFPGMDPYLEDPLIWHPFHQRFVVHLADHLQPLLEPRYITSTDARVYVEGPEHREIAPDIWVRRNPRQNAGQPTAVLEATPEEVRMPAMEIHETCISILDRTSGQRVVTAIEVVSPTNKYPGAGRSSYLQKQSEVRASQTHLVEIDLLRTGRHVLTVPEWLARGRGEYDYLACVNRASNPRDVCEIYRIELRQRLPRIRIPLTEGDADVVADLQAVFDYTFRLGSYRNWLPYDRPCIPPLSPGDQAWADELIRSAQSTNGNS